MKIIFIKLSLNSFFLRLFVQADEPAFYVWYAYYLLKLYICSIFISLLTICCCCILLLIIILEEIVITQSAVLCFPQVSLYRTVVEDVIISMKEAFSDEGVDSQVLQELKQVGDR